MWLFLQPICTKTEQILSYFLSSSPCTALWVRQGHQIKQSMEPAVCGVGWRRWPTSSQKCVFCSPGCLTCEGQNQGLERKCWPEQVLREGCIAWGRAQEGWVVSEFMPPQELTLFTGIGSSCRMHCCGSKYWTTSFSQCWCVCLLHSY